MWNFLEVQFFTFIFTGSSAKSILCILLVQAFGPAQKQCAAVSTNWLLMMDPPHWELAMSIRTIHGIGYLVSFPPTTLWSLFSIFFLSFFFSTSFFFSWDLHFSFVIAVQSVWRLRPVSQIKINPKILKEISIILIILTPKFQKSVIVRFICSKSPSA